MSEKFGLWTDRDPPQGVVTLRGERFVPSRQAEVLDDGFLDDIASEKRPGWTKKNRTTFGTSCRAFDGDAWYADIPYYTSDNLGSKWCREIRVTFHDVLPTGDATIFCKRTNVANTDHLWIYYQASTGKIICQFDTASEAVVLTSASLMTRDVVKMLSIDRNDGDVRLYFDGVLEDTVAMGAGALEVNKINTARWLFGARADSASGNEADDQFARLIIGEERDWSLNRGVAAILANHDLELAESDTTNLRHYRRFRAGRNRRVIYDSDTHITQANRRNAWCRPCGPYFVDRHYPSHCDPWSETNEGIKRGEEWRRFDGIGVAAAGQHDRFTPSTAVEDVINRLEGGISQWVARREAIFERATVLECLADYSLGAASNDPAIRFEKLANDTLRLSAKIGGVIRTATTTATVSDCIPYVIHGIRRDVDLTIMLHRKDTGALLEEVTVAVPAGVGDAVAGGVWTVGKQRDGANPLVGALGPDNLYREYAGPFAISEPSPLRASQAVVNVATLRNGRNVLDFSSNTNLTADCVPVDVDIPDGPIPSDCAAGTRPLTMGHFHGIYDYQKTSADYSTVGTQRTVIVSFGGAIYEANHARTGDLTFKVVRRGVSEGRTALSDWLQYVDELVLLNGIDANLIRDRGGRWAKCGVEPPSAGPSLALNGGGGNLTAGGTYSYFTVNRDPTTGHRSMPSAATSITIGATDDAVDVTNIVVATDPDRPNMIRELYRTQWGIGGQGVDYYLVATLNDNSVTITTDDFADSAIVPALKLEQDEFGFYVGGVPPISRYGVNHAGRGFYAGDPENPTRLWWTRIGNLQAVPASYFVDLADQGTGNPITALWKVYDRLFIGTENSIWELKATGRVGTFKLQEIVTGIGPSGQWSVAVYHGTSFFWNAGQKKLYRWDGQGSPEYISWKVEPTVDDFNGDAMRYSSAQPYEFRNQIWLTASTGTTDDSKEGDEGIPENDKVMVYDMARDEFTFLNQDNNILAEVEDPVTHRNRLWAGDYMGFVRNLDEGESDGYDQVGFDKRGTIAAAPAPTPTGMTLLDHASLAASLPTAGDGLMGCPFFLIRANADGVLQVVAKSRVYVNTSGAVVLQTALSVAPIAGDTWAIGGIHYRHKTIGLDFDRNIDAKGLLEATLFTRLESGDAQAGANTALVHFYQDGQATSGPPSSTIDLTAPELSTNPLYRLEVWRLGVYHALEVESFFPDQPCKIEGCTLRYEPSELSVEAT